ncbi:Transcription factor IIIA [Tolypocladium capitatum]|uniref:Transcription factor IIIA n=1 Tax=Tolypocladium capitatum TaxID=45235 RepID=A0A2K3QBR2_9HYPO|nr:Transcription factor IIIA [Tolypocladium capitatum]
MSKRSAAREPLGASPPKRPRIEGAGSPCMDDGDDDFTSAQTPSSMADADSPVTVATTPRAKFPSDLKTLACTWPGCPKTFNRPARLRDHLNSHTNSRPFKCTYDDCDKDYIEDKHLKQHIKAVHTHDRKYVCQREGCGKTFVTGTRLKRHQAVHEGADRFRCQDCGQSFRKKETLHKHVRKEHEDKKAFECSEPGCHDEFDSKPALKRHCEKTHGEIKFWCGECGLTTAEGGTEHRVGFTTELLLQQHLKQEHQNCIFCEYKSLSRWELEQHIEMHHSGKTVEDRKTHACPYDGCEKKFTKRSNLNVHIRTAHEGFRFACGEVDLSGPDFEGWSNDRGCGGKFSTKVRLEDHIRFIHLGQERPKLSKAETSLTDLIDEISGVTNQAKATIACLNCDETFIRYFDLDLHLSKDHDPTREEAAADPASFLVQTQALIPEPSVFEQDYAQSAWPADMPQEEIFAAQIDYGPPRDDWLEDEANIFLLARDPPGELDSNIDPALGGF